MRRNITIRWAILIILLFVSVYELNVLYTTILYDRGPFPHYEVSLRFPITFLGLCAFGFLFARLSRFWACALCVVNAVFYMICVEFFEHFHTLISYQVIANNISDFWGVFSFDNSWVNYRTLAVVGSFLGLKIILVFLLHAVQHNSKAFKYFGYANLLIWVFVYALSSYKFSNKFLANSEDVANLKFNLREHYGKYFGVLPTFIAERYIFDDKKLLEVAKEYAKITSDKITAVDSVVGIGANVAVIQAESLDFDIIDFKHDGEEISPFINKMKSQGYFYKVKAHHFNGSADADFVFLNRVHPCPQCLNYYILDFPYGETTADIVMNRGYEFKAIHPLNAGYFNMKYACDKMRIPSECLIFREDLIESYGVERQSNVFGVNDEDVFKVSADLMRASSGPSCHFLITITSHAPFDFYPRDRKLAVDSPSSRADHYYNSIRYLDKVVESYVASLPEGTVIFIYGDHESAVRPEYMGFHDGRKAEYVPFIVFKKGDNVAKKQKSRGDLALSGELSHLDSANFIANHFN